MPAGRPSIYSDELAEEICHRIADGESLRKICLDEGKPSRSTIMLWLTYNEEFRTKYTRAREFQAEYMDDLILDTANACTSETANADRVKVSAYQWRAAKLLPKKYGDKQEVTHEAGDSLTALLKAVDGATRGIPTGG